MFWVSPDPSGSQPGLRGGLHLLGPTPFLPIRSRALIGYGLGPLLPPAPEQLAPCVQAMSTLLRDARRGHYQSLVTSSVPGPAPGPVAQTLAPGNLNAAISRTFSSKFSSCFQSLGVGVGEVLLAMWKF